MTEASGKYVYADNGSGRIVALDTSQEPPVEVDLAKVGQLGQLGISSVQAAPNGDILVITLGSKSSATDRSGGPMQHSRPRGARRPRTL